MSSYKCSNFRGSHSEVGFAIGKSVEGRLAGIIDSYIANVDRLYGIDFDRLQTESFAWFERLPEEYRIELEHMSAGAACPLEKIIHWIYSDMGIAGGCTSFLYQLDGKVWVGRNNDYIYPNIWNHVAIISVTGKIPTMLFGLEASTFSGTGFNKEKVWLHYNWLPDWDKPGGRGDMISPFVFIRKALENCRSLQDVEELLARTERDGGMNLFAVDGKTNESAVYECTCQSFHKRQLTGRFIAGTNHYCMIEAPAEVQLDCSDSFRRFQRVNELLASKKITRLPEDLTSILADSGVEKQGELSGTVYSNVACPHEERIWLAADGFPAASQGCWEEMIWNW